MRWKSSTRLCHGSLPETIKLIKESSTTIEIFNTLSQFLQIFFDNSNQNLDKFVEFSLPYQTLKPKGCVFSAIDNSTRKRDFFVVKRNFKIKVAILCTKLLGYPYILQK